MIGAESAGPDAGSAGPPGPESFAAGSKVGPFVVTEKIGEGGMATVYRARRDTEDFHQEVAIKVLKHVVDGAEGVARFERECAGTPDRWVRQHLTNRWS